MSVSRAITSGLSQLLIYEWRPHPEDYEVGGIKKKKPTSSITFKYLQVSNVCVCFVSWSIYLMGGSSVFKSSGYFNSRALYSDPQNIYSPLEYTHTYFFQI